MGRDPQIALPKWNVTLTLDVTFEVEAETEEQAEEYAKEAMQSFAVSDKDLEHEPEIVFSEFAYAEEMA